MDKIFFLDRNALSDIKKSISGGKVPIDRLKRLRDIDKAGHTISLMFAFREGQNKKIENSHEMEESINKDAPSIDRFYNKARTDAHYFLENIKFTTETLSDIKGKEFNWENYIEFLKYVQAKLYQPVSRKERYEIAEKKCKKSHDLTISKGHPIIICAISALYGNLNSQKILKAKPSLTGIKADEHAYNVLNDLIIISRISALQIDLGANAKLKLVTFDKPLEQFFKLIKVEKIKRINHVDSTSTETTITYSFDTFTDAKEEEQDRLIKLIKNNL